MMCHLSETMLCRNWETAGLKFVGCTTSGFLSAPHIQLVQTLLQLVSRICWNSGRNISVGAVFDLETLS